MSVTMKVVIYIIALILPLNLIALSVTNNLVASAVETVTTAEQNLADLYMESLNTRMKNTASLMNYYITKDTNFIRMTQQEGAGYSYDSAKMKFYSSFIRLAALTDGADGYYFYMSIMNDSISYGSSSIATEIKDFVLSEGPVSAKQYGWRILTLGNRQFLVATYNLNQVTFGAWIDLEAIKSEIKTKIEYQSTSVEFTAEDEYVQDNDKIVIKSSLKSIVINISHDREEMLRQISPRQRILQTAAIIYLFAIPLLYIFLRFFLFKPLKKINKAHRELQKGNFDYRIEDKGSSSEYSEAFKSFNLMAEKLKSYRIEVYEKEIARQKMELRNLQLQIRPHFLLNTFNLIHTLVQNKQNKSVETVIIYLSEYFRFIFRSDKDLVPLPQELDLINGYLKIASIRYNNEVEATIEIDPILEMLLVPPLLLHNFVENSVKHGKKQGTILHITIRGTYSDGIVTFCIGDDGNGMGSETLARIRSVLDGELEFEDQYSHIGVYNSFKRLRWYYGENAKIEVDSENGKMTLFTIKIPCNLEVDDESAHCE